MGDIHRHTDKSALLMLHHGIKATNNFPMEEELRTARYPLYKIRDTFQSRPRHTQPRNETVVIFFIRFHIAEGEKAGSTCVEVTLGK